jgi:hypothetical protein
MTDNEFIEKFRKNNENNEYYEKIINPNKEDVIVDNYALWEKIEKEIADFEGKMNDDEAIELESQIYSKNKIIEQRLDKLNGCYVMEYTPLGNVLMKYNKERTTFTYYSDSTIPYRYLEVVARKFVKTFHCRPIFIDMEEELTNYEKKIVIRAKALLNVTQSQLTRALTLNLMKKLELIRLKPK